MFAYERAALPLSHIGGVTNVKHYTNGPVKFQVQNIKSARLTGPIYVYLPSPNLVMVMMIPMVSMPAGCGGAALGLLVPLTLVLAERVGGAGGAEKRRGVLMVL